MLRRNRPNRLPGISGLSIDSFGWPLVSSTDSAIQWRDGVDVLSLNYFPVAPDVAGFPDEDRALSDQFRSDESSGGYAAVDAHWTREPSGRPVAQLILKAPQKGSGMIYQGSLIIPFAACSWIVRLQRHEVGTTGIREALWLDQHLASGGSLQEAGIDTSAEPLPADSAPPPVRRGPADDPEWDDLVPQHPLSRLRRGMTSVLASVRLSPQAQRLAPLG